MQPYPYSNYPNYNSNNQYTYSNQLYQQPYYGQYGNTNLGKYPQNLNINVSQPTNSVKPTSNKKPVKKVEVSSSSSSEDEEEQKSESDDASNSDDDEDKKSKSENNSEEKQSDKSKDDSDSDDEKESNKSKAESSDDDVDVRAHNSEKSNEETDEKPIPENENKDVEKDYPELKERVKVFRNITQELDDLEDFLKKHFQYFPSEDSETAISEKFTRK